MGWLFNTSKPRRFHHDMIYTDERRRRLSRLEQRARMELGLSGNPGHQEQVTVDLYFLGRRKQRPVSSGQTGLLRNSLIGLFVLGVAIIVMMMI